MRPNRARALRWNSTDLFLQRKLAGQLIKRCVIFRLLDFCNILVLLSLAAATGSVQIRMLNAELHWSARRHQQHTSSGDQLGFFFPWYGSDISSLSRGSTYPLGSTLRMSYPARFRPSVGSMRIPGRSPLREWEILRLSFRPGMKGYDVYLYGALLGKEGTGGDDLDVSSNSM